MTATTTWKPSIVLSVCFNFAMLFFFFFLDIRDLYYKTQWMGPRDSFSFTATSIDLFQNESIKLATPRNSTSTTPLRQRVPFASGWGSFLQSCDNLFAISSSPSFFLQVRGTNCLLGDHSQASSLITKDLFMVSNLRVDAAAWASCQLILRSRRPALCQSSTVANFLKRYNIELAMIPKNWLVGVDTAGERELLALIQLISRASSRSRVICTAGFEFDFDRAVGTYGFGIFGCGSADEHKSVLVGHFASGIRYLLADKLWLTLDDFNVLGFHFTIRQNDRPSVKIDQSFSGGSRVLRLTHTSEINFSSFGSLYVLLLCIDITLMILYLFTALELISFLILPLLSRDVTKEEIDFFQNENYTNFFSRSLYRSRPVMLLALTSQLLSWMIILPNAIMWTWSVGDSYKIQVFLSTLRLWTLLLMSVNVTWDLFVAVAESKAFEIAKRTYLTTVDLIVIGMSTCYLRRARIFDIGSTKYVLEKQRMVDTSTFTDAKGGKVVAFGNTFNERLDGLISTPLQVVSMLYLPLLKVLAESLLHITWYTLVKMAYYHHVHFRGKHQKVQAVTQVMAMPTPMHIPTPLPRAHGSTSKPTSKASERSKPSTRSSRSEGRSRLGWVYDSFAPRTLVKNVVAQLTLTPLRQEADQYARLPLEQALDTPIRARSLVRTALEMEVTLGDRMYMRPPLYFEFGVFVRKGVVMTRVGFFDMVGSQIRLTGHVQEENVSHFVSSNVPLR